jgi:hypothetical protein
LPIRHPETALRLSCMNAERAFDACIRCKHYSGMPD